MLPGRAKDHCEDILATSGDPNARSIAWNLLHEHRLSKSRSDHWESTAGGALTASLEAGLRVYLDFVERNPYSSYLDSSNATNHPRPWDDDLPEPTRMLAHVLDLTGAAAMAIWRFGKDGGVPEIERLDLASSDALSASLTLLLANRPLHEQVTLMREFFGARERYLSLGGRASPAWVVLWDAWRGRIDPGLADTWAAAVGLSKQRANRWLAVLKYHAGKAEKLVRPTQLEAGWFGRHFPSPPACSLGSGGRVVEGIPKKTAVPLREYLHPPISWTEYDWMASGLPVLATANEIGAVTKLSGDRQAHWNGLRIEVGDGGVIPWMKEPNG